MKSHDEIMRESAQARKAAKSESGIWAESTSSTPEELESAYESYVVTELESGNDDYLNFERWAEEIYGISNK